MSWWFEYELRLYDSKYFVSFFSSMLAFKLKLNIPVMNSAYQASVIYYLESVGSIFCNHIHHPHIFVFQSSCKWSHACFHVHQVPQSIRVDLCTQNIPVIVNPLLPNFLHHDQSNHTTSSCDLVFVFMCAQAENVMYAYINKEILPWITVSLSNMSLV